MSNWLHRIADCFRRPLDVWVLAGQSNAGGLADGAGFYLVPGALLTYVRQPGRPKETCGEWGPLSPQEIYDGGSWRFGPEIGFARAMNRPVAVIKYSLSNTMMKDWLPGTELFESFTAFVAEQREALGIRHRVRGLLWVHGESDELWDANVTEFYDDLDLFATTMGLPMILTRTHLPGGIRDKQKIFAETHGHKWINTDDLPRLDELHYDAAGQLELGRRMAVAALE